MPFLAKVERQWGYCSGAPSMLSALLQWIYMASSLLPPLLSSSHLICLVGSRKKGDAQMVCLYVGNDNSLSVKLMVWSSQNTYMFSAAKTLNIFLTEKLLWAPYLTRLIYNYCLPRRNSFGRLVCSVRPDTTRLVLARSGLLRPPARSLTRSYGISLRVNKARAIYEECT